MCARVCVGGVFYLFILLFLRVHLYVGNYQNMKRCFSKEWWGFFSQWIISHPYRHPLIWVVKICTLPKTNSNMSPENWWLEDVFSIEMTSLFRGHSLVFQGVREICKTSGISRVKHGLWGAAWRLLMGLKLLCSFADQNCHPKNGGGGGGKFASPHIFLDVPGR